MEINIKREERTTSGQGHREEKDKDLRQHKLRQTQISTQINQINMLPVPVVVPVPVPVPVEVSIPVSVPVPVPVVVPVVVPVEQTLPSHLVLGPNLALPSHRHRTTETERTDQEIHQIRF